jgi:hypothetical protein
MKCRECGADGVIKTYKRKNRSGETRSFRCSAVKAHNYFLKKDENDEPAPQKEAQPPAQTAPAAKKKSARRKKRVARKALEPARTAPPRTTGKPKRSVIGHILASIFDDE